MAVFFGKDLDDKIHRKIMNTNGNYIILDLTVHDQKVTLINLYGPYNDNPQFFPRYFELHR